MHACKNNDACGTPGVRQNLPRHPTQLELRRENQSGVVIHAQKVDFGLFRALILYVRYPHPTVPPERPLSEPIQNNLLREQLSDAGCYWCGVVVPLALRNHLDELVDETYLQHRIQRFNGIIGHAVNLQKVQEHSTCLGRSYTLLCTCMPIVSNIQAAHEGAGQHPHGPGYT